MYSGGILREANRCFSLCFSHTLGPLIESRENQGNQQYVSNDITLLFFPFDTQSDDLLNAARRLMTDKKN